LTQVPLANAIDCFENNPISKTPVDPVMSLHRLTVHKFQLTFANFSIWHRTRHYMLKNRYLLRFFGAFLGCNNSCGTTKNLPIKSYETEVQNGKSHRHMSYLGLKI